MIDLSPIRQARETLQTRQNGLIQTIRDRNPARYSADNANQDNSWEGKWLNADQERMRQLDWLQKALEDDDLTKTVEDEAAARETANNLQSDTSHRQLSGANASTMTRAGRAGSSVNAANVLRINAARDAAKAQAKAQADELRAAGISGVEDMERQLVDQIMSESGAYEAAQQAAVNGQQVEIAGARRQAELNDSYRNILANTLGNVLTSTVSPIASGGFDYADRQNQKQEAAIMQALTNGQTPQTYKPTTWWGI